MTATGLRGSHRSGLEREIGIGGKLRKVRPVVWWAALGLVFLAEYVWVFGNWLLHLPPKVPTGPTRVPWYMTWNIRAQEVLFLGITVAGLIRFIARPLVKRQPIPLEGLVFTAFFTMMWQNYGIIWFRTWSSMNAVVVNRGSWYSDVAFWGQPETSTRFAEAWLMELGFYSLWAVATIWLAFIMRRVRRRWPSMSKLKLFGFILVFSMLLDLSAETLWMRGGLYHYGGAPRGWHLLFEGHYYQFPLLEAPLFGGVIALFAAILYFRNDRGQTIIERGIEDVGVSQKARTAVRWLALVGFLNLAIVFYNAAWQPVILRYGGEWPADIQSRSYFTQNICGARTDRICPGPAVPDVRPGSAEVTKDGTLRYPPGVDPPLVDVPFKK